MSIVDDRRETHGDPVRNVRDIADAWTLVLSRGITPEQVCDCMAALHEVRHRNAPVHDPSHMEHAEGYREIRAMLDAGDN